MMKEIPPVKKLGKQVPTEIGVVTFDNYPFAEYMNRTIKNSVLTPLTDGGHGAFYECKDEINKSLEAFIYNYLQ